MGKFFGADKFEPRRILRQIAVIQALFYILYAATLIVCRVVFSVPFQPMLSMFSASGVTVYSSTGWASIIALLVASAAIAVVFTVVIERARKCLDFSVTMYFVHFCVVWGYSELPKSWDWWLVMCLCAVGTTLLGEYLCMRQELQDIPVADLPSGRGGAAAAGSAV